MTPLRALLFTAVVLTAATAIAPAAEDGRGQAIYKKLCADCHGADGQGVDDQYADPLAGDLPLGGLQELIADTMPEGDPDACVGDDAAAVANYIHDAFYSEAARVRNRPPRISLSRLTAEQLRQSYADLYGRFQQPPWMEGDRGVRAIYFDGSRWKNDKKKIERVDPVIEFDFGDEGPGEGINKQDFYIHWSGSLKVDHSGRYEIILRSTCSCTMDFGADDRELINNHVQSQGKEEFRRKIHLTAGRAYPFNIDFIQRKRKTKQPPAKISLSWVAPGGIEEIIPARHLLPTSMPDTFALQAKLPPDDRSYGYERGTTINRSWDESTTASALEFAEVAAEELYPRYRRRHRKEPDENRAKLRAFLSESVQTAFRGPLDEATRRHFIDEQLDQSEDDAEAIKRVLLLSLKSPRFLYPTLDNDRSSSQRAANRLALVFFDSLPSDEWLRKKAERDQLKNRKQISDAAYRMVNDYRTRAKTLALLYQWFDLAQQEEITKDQQIFPEFDRALVSDLQRSLDAFFEEVVWNEPSDFRQLLRADWMYTSNRIQDFYGEAWKPEDGNESDSPRPQRSIAEANVHVGAITHPLLMSSLAYQKTSSPIHRGVFLTRHALGRVIRPPDAAFTPLNPDLHPKLTTRQRVELQTGEVNCQVCHQKINSLGFALENFDAVGRYRTTEKDKTIDANGGYTTLSGDKVTFTGARELGDFLAGSPDCQRSFVEATFEHFVKQPITAFGPDTSERLTKSFQDSEFNIQQLLVSIALLVAEHAQQPSLKT